MTRVSLKEAYDNKDVIAQIYAIRDTAESAVDTSEQAVTTANTASDHVDALVPQVEGAVANANSASASAQASAQTVAGYENRLGAVEGDVVQLNTDVDGVESDLNAVTLRVTTAEGQIVTIEGRVTALETADGQNVKLTGPNAIGNYAVLLTGNQSIQANKNFVGELITSGIWNNKSSGNLEQSSTWRRVYYNITTGSNQMLALFMTPAKPNQNSDEYGILIVGNNYAKWCLKGSGVIPANFVVTTTLSGNLELWVKNYSGNRGVSFVRLNETNWGNIISNWRADSSTIDANFDPTDTTKYIAYKVSE